MNIFVCDEDPIIAARNLPDKLIVKMQLEGLQLASGAIRRLEDYPPGLILKDTHINHPCAKWARESKANLHWLLTHTFWISKFYTERYGRQHMYFQHIKDLLDWCKPSGELTPFAQAMPDHYKNDNAVEAYRLYMQKEKSYYATWKTPHTKPDWWKERCKQDVRENI